MLRKIVDGPLEQEVIVGVECLEYAPPPNPFPPTPPEIPEPPFLIGGGVTDPPPEDTDCSDVQVIDYKDSLGRCWRAIVYPCAAPNYGNVHRSPTTCP